MEIPQSWIDRLQDYINESKDVLENPNKYSEVRNINTHWKLIGYLEGLKEL